MRFLQAICLMVVAVVVTLGAARLQANTAIISTGDNLVMMWSPYDSQASIHANIEAMQRDWGLNRFWWRAQHKYFYEYADIVQDDSTMKYSIWNWWFEQNDNASAAVDICSNLGIESWFWTGLFEFGAGESTGGGNYLPYIFEHRLRKEHPEWLPVNKYGTRQQGGPIEFCYPQARSAYIQTLEDFLLQEGYDGIVFYTYVENFGTRYLDEFGFNQPIVDEFLSRYGVDIRTEPFDKEAWADLRGEYVTQFLRELRTALQPYGIKIAVQLSSKDIGGQGPRPDLPSAWPGVWSTQETQRIGRIRMDWQTWADEGLVDELNIYYPGSESVAIEIRDYCQLYNPAVEVSMYPMGGTIDPFPAGVRRISYFPGGTPIALQSGFPAEQVGSPPNNYPNPSQTLQVGDKWQKRQVLYLATLGHITLSLNDIAAAATDEDIFVRSMAVRALKATGLSAAIPVIEERLNDAENYVRCLAAETLGTMPGAESLEKMLDAIVLHGNYQYNMYIVPEAVRQMETDGTLGTTQRLLLKHYFTHPNAAVRQSVVYSVAVAGIASEFKNELLAMAGADTDRLCRTLSMYHLAVNFAISDTYNVLKNNIQGADSLLQVRAAEALRFYTGSRELDEAYKERALSLLFDLFEQYGTGSQRVDQGWGWQSVGNTILTIGAEGQAALDDVMCRTTDQQLADLIWRVLYVRQYRNQYAFVTEEQDETAHVLHPFMNGVPCRVDFVRDGIIDLKDFAFLAEAWLDCNLHPEEACH